MVGNILGTILGVIICGFGLLWMAGNFFGAMMSDSPSASDIALKDFWWGVPIFTVGVLIIWAIWHFNG